jgi:Uncharacterized distant relative of homeotic protein bithoraxoid
MNSLSKRGTLMHGNYLGIGTGGSLYTYNSNHNSDHNEHGIEQKILNVLEDLKNSVPGMKGVALASSDGLPMVTAFSSEVNKELICAMAAALYNTGTRVGNMLKLKNFKSTTVELENGLILVSNVKNAVLLAFMEANGNLGIAKLKMPKVCEKIEKILF